MSSLSRVTEPYQNFCNLELVTWVVTPEVQSFVTFPVEPVHDLAAVAPAFFGSVLATFAPSYSRGLALLFFRSSRLEVLEVLTVVQDILWRRCEAI